MEAAAAGLGVSLCGVLILTLTDAQCFIALEVVLMASSQYLDLVHISILHPLTLYLHCKTQTTQITCHTWHWQLA